MNLAHTREMVDGKRAEFEAKRVLCRTMGESLEDAVMCAESAMEAQELAQAVALIVQQQAHDQIAKVVSRCLTEVFDEPYVFRIHFERKRGRTQARLAFERDGMEVDPMTASGGGIIDVASFALRLSCLVLNKPPLRRVLVMDEPFKYVSEEYRERVKILLETLAVEMSVQLILVTHITELQIGTVYEIG